MILYWSSDDGTLYTRDEVDDPSAYIPYEVDEVVVLTPEQFTGHHGDVIQLLLAAGVAREIPRL